MVFVSKPRLQDHYFSTICPILKNEFGYSSVMQIPHIEKIVINMGVKDGVKDIKLVEQAASELMLITGQKPVITKAAKAIASFKLRAKTPIGCKVTLRRKIMYEFLDRLINIALPRGKDFRGISSKQFDGAGNFCFGLKEHLIFPEIDYDKVQIAKGMDIAIVTTAKTDAEAKALLRNFNFPFI